MSCDSLCEHRLARTWRTEHQNSFPRSSNPYKVVRHDKWEKHSLLESLLWLIQLGNVIELYLWIFINHVSLQHLYEVRVWPDAVWIRMVKERGLVWIATSLASILGTVSLRVEPRPVVVPVLAIDLATLRWLARWLL